MDAGWTAIIDVVLHGLAAAWKAGTEAAAARKVELTGSAPPIDYKARQDAADAARKAKAT